MTQNGPKLYLSGHGNPLGNGRPSMETGVTTVSAALRRGAVAGLILGTVAVIAGLLLPTATADEWVYTWVLGTSLILGIIGTVAGLVFTVMARTAGRWIQGRYPIEMRDYFYKHYLAGAVSLERTFLYSGVPSLIVGMMLILSMVLQGKTKF